MSMKNNSFCLKFLQVQRKSLKLQGKPLDKLNNLREKFKKKKLKKNYTQNKKKAL